MPEDQKPPPVSSLESPAGVPFVRRLRLVVVVPLVIVVAVIWWAAAFFSIRPSAPPGHFSSDPRLLYDGPYRNVRPDVAYVGDRACALCHADISRSYHRHPMARSLIPIGDAQESQWYDAAHHNPFVALGDSFQIERREERVWHCEKRLDAKGRPLYTFETEVTYAIGSGTHGRSYLSNRDGYLFQTAISWYAQKHVWDLSPGFNREALSGRPVSGECLFCHANRTHFQEGSLNHYEKPVFEGNAIGCERCHGPGEKHVQSKESLDIVNPTPKRLAPDLCDAVCEQCHLEGVERIVRRQRGLYDFRPGLPLQDFWRIFVRPSKPGAKYRAVTHVEQMRASRCYPGRLDTGRMFCVSCHDPHVAVAPEERVAYYRSRCLKCHEHTGCSLPRPVRLERQADDSCIACHMPRFPAADIAHTAATDHRIPRWPSPAATEQLPSDEDENRALEPFHLYQPEDEAEVQRDLGLALLKMMQSHEMSPELNSARAEALLAGAVRRDADDVPAWEALGLTLLIRHRGVEGLAVLENVLHRDPNRETALTAAATLAWNLKRGEESLAYWRRAVAVNPWLPSYRRSLTQVLLQLRQWDEARSSCRDWLRLDPMSLESRQAWIDLLLREGKTIEAREEFTRLEALNPPNLASLRTWFNQRMR